jgi:hypothetical protein
VTPDRADTIVVEVAEEDLVGVIELLSFVINLCGSQNDAINKAIYYFTRSSSWAADELADEAADLANRLARALGFADLDFGLLP